MPIYLLTANDFSGADDNPWSSPYDCFFGHVVVAPTPQLAREAVYADRGPRGDEDQSPTDPYNAEARRKVWLDPHFTSCKEIDPTDSAHVILSDFNAG